MLSLMGQVGLLAIAALPFLIVQANAATDFPSIVPAVHSFTSSGERFFSLPSTLTIVVDQDVASTADDDGLTLIPPTLLSFAKTFASDAESVFPGIITQVSPGTSTTKADVFMTIMSEAEAANFTLAKGTPTSEGYSMTITSSSVVISGSGARGAFWATRTLLQALLLSDKELPSGMVVDQPDWQTRGYMLDVGRQFYPITFLEELCTYASWWKTSEFHVHLSDNYGIDVTNTTYARFRLRPSNPALAGLTPHLNETYTYDEFIGFQEHCAARGVTIIPEIESPGHALVITQWKPELALSTDMTLINLTVPDAIPTIKSIWTEFLPWFMSKQVSIGADEYDSDLADDYNNFVNDMSAFIAEANKTIRIWGTNEPSNTTSVEKNITIQHWEFFEDDPYELIRDGYNVVNSDDAFQYIVMKYSGSYPQRLNQTRLWQGANVDTEGIWDPHIFDRGNASNNPTVAEPLLQGAIMAVWNDHGPNASTVLEAFYAFKMGLPVIAANSWQSSTRANHLTEEQYLASFPILEASAPGQNLDRRVPSASDVVLSYELENQTSGVVKDLSGNGYDGEFVDGVIITPLGSKGHNYTFLVNASTSDTTGTLLSGPDTSFGYTAYGNGTTLAFTSSNFMWPLLNYTLPANGASAWREIVIAGTENQTFAYVDGEFVGEYEIGVDGTTVMAPMSFVAPVQHIGNGAGSVAKFIIWDGLKDITYISESASR